MLGGCSRRKELFADEAPAHARSDDNEHLADLVGASAGWVIPHPNTGSMRNLITISSDNHLAVTTLTSGCDWQDKATR